MPRIVSLIASATEIVCALGFEGQLVGRSHECDFPESVRRLPVCTAPKFDVEGSSCEIDQRVKALLRDALSVYRVDEQRLRELEPDVIVTQSQCDVCAVSLRDVERAVCSWLSACPRLVSLQPNALADVWTDIEHVAEALDVRERGDELIRSLQGRMGAIAGRSQSLPSRPTVACIEWIDPLMAAGNWMPELVEMAGGVNLFGEAGKHSPWMTWDELVEARPGRDPGAAVRLRHRPVAARPARPDGPAGVAAVEGGARRPRLPDERQPVFQPAGSAIGGVAGDSGRVAAPGGVPVRP